MLQKRKIDGRHNLHRYMLLLKFLKNDVFKELIQSKSKRFRRYQGNNIFMWRKCSNDDRHNLDM